MTSTIDKKWMGESDRASATYIQGVSTFLEFVINNGGGHKRYSCPCKACRNGKGMVTLGTITLHLFENGIDQTYTTWTFHGEKVFVEDKCVQPVESAAQSEDVYQPRMDDLVDDAFELDGFGATDALADATMIDCNDGPSEVHIDPTVEEGTKCNLSNASAREPLYPSCPRGTTTLHVATKLNNLKKHCNWSDDSVTLLLEFMKEILPEGNTLPTKYSEMKTMVDEVGVDSGNYDGCMVVSRSPQSPSNSSTQKPEEVITSDYGVPVGWNSNHISNRLGCLVRTHVPISYADWKKVPGYYKDAVWKYLLTEFDLHFASRKYIEGKMSEAFKKHKYKLRSKYYKTKATQEERKRNVPPNCREEEWVQFCDNENTEFSLSVKEKNKINRALQMSYGPTSARRGNAKIEAVLRDEIDDPIADIERAKTWVEVRTRKDGTVLQSAAPYVEKIVKVLETQGGSSGSSESPDVDAPVVDP